jgi:outer membrane immunogenic protein
MKSFNSSVAVAALAAFLMAAPASAADIEAPLPAAVDWTAFHVGAGGGGLFGFVEEDADSFIGASDLLISPFVSSAGQHETDLGDAAFFGTVEAGFDYQLGTSVVIGVLANYDFGKTKLDNESATVVTSEFIGPPVVIDSATYETKWEIGDSWTVGGRLGFLAMDNALIYVLGGYTQAKVKSESSLSADSNADFSFATSHSGWEDGWFAGGGIEALLTDHISLKAEYRFADYGSVDNEDDDLNFLEEFSFSEARSSMAGDITVHSVRAVLSYRFGL